MMQFTTTRAVFAALVFAMSPAIAQETAPTTETTPTTESVVDKPGGLSTGTAVTADGEAVGSAYVASTSGDWQIRCVRAAEGPDLCQLYQLITDDAGASVAEIAVFPLQNQGRAVAGATIITPLETLLTEQVQIAVDGGATRKYPFSFCTAQGCVSRIGFTADDLNAFKAGNVAKLTVVPVVAPDQKVTVDISLAGFTAGFNGLNGQ